MTMVVTVLIGAGVLLISSAVDCTPLVSTFQKIISNQSIDWSGAQNCQATGTTTPTATAPATIGSGKSLIPPLSSGRCPAGYTQVFVSGGKIMCEPS